MVDTEQRLHAYGRPTHVEGTLGEGPVGELSHDPERQHLTVVVQIFRFLTPLSAKTSPAELIEDESMQSRTAARGTVIPVEYVQSLHELVLKVIACRRSDLGLRSLLAVAYQTMKFLTFSVPDSPTSSSLSTLATSDSLR